jgi:hypothetical protein
MLKKTLLFALLIMLSGKQVHSQNNWSLSFGGGISYYYGDLNDRILTHTRFIRPAGMLSLNRDLGNQWRFRLCYIHGGAAGADSVANNRSVRVRNLSFKSPLDEISAQIVFRPIKHGLTAAYHPYLFAGIGGLHFNPKAKLNDIVYKLQPLGTEGQNIPGGEYDDPYSLWTISIPFGVGMQFMLSENWDLGIEVGYHKLFTDYIDDVSKKYPSKPLLTQAPDGELAVIFSDRSLTNSIKDGSNRGNALNDDGFMHATIFLTWYPKKRSKYSGDKSGSNCYAF